jgi:catechol 2,3-dioxygenase-like lactoylglutathione lyase family enzyme
VIRGLQHVNIEVEDVEAARAFYAGTLGLREIPRGEGREREGAWFQLDGGAQLHVSLQPGCAERNRASKRHFCLSVEDLDALRRTLPDIQDKGTRIFVRDPSGNRIEIQPSR